MAAWYSLSELPSRKWSEVDWMVVVLHVVDGVGLFVVGEIG